MNGLFVIVGVAGSLVLLNILYDWLHKKIDIAIYNREAGEKYNQDDIANENDAWKNEFCQGVGNKMLHEDDYYTYYDENYQWDYEPAELKKGRQGQREDILLSEEDIYRYYESTTPETFQKEKMKEETRTKKMNHPLLEHWENMFKTYQAYITKEEKYALQEQLPNDLKRLLVSFEKLNDALKTKHQKTFDTTIDKLKERSSEIQTNIDERIEQEFVSEVRKVVVKH